jgi:hypothetical protein
MCGDWHRAEDSAQDARGKELARFDSNPFNPELFSK